MSEENQGGEDRPMYDAVCSDCGKETKVPFEPQEGRPVYCKDCYQKHRPPRKSFGNRGGFGNRGNRGGFRDSGNRGGFRDRGNKQNDWDN
jgi:CxxC-x17-CxxC domain-containing protein